MVSTYFYCFDSCRFSENDPLFEHDSVDHLEQDNNSLVTDGAKEPTSREFEQHYDMLHDIDHEKDIYRLRVSVIMQYTTGRLSGIL